MAPGLAAPSNVNCACGPVPSTPTVTISPALSSPNRIFSDRLSSVGNVLFQVFCCEQKDAVLGLDNETWLEPKGLYVPALLQIAPGVAPIRWTPEVVFTVDDLKPLAGRLQQGLSSRA